jgi:hypothetical protein
MEDARIPGDERQLNHHNLTNTSQAFPAFDECLPELNRFILELVEAYESGQIDSWDGLEEKVTAYFTPARMEQMESLVPGWQKMASYSDGITLVHVMCVFLGMLMLPEFGELTAEEKNMAKWIVLFHDLDKKAGKGARDLIHGFRSAVRAAKQLPHVGFPVTAEYGRLIDSWSESTYAATKLSAASAEPVQNNDRLPEILIGIERMFGPDTPAARIVNTVLLHMSINVVREWPQAAPLTELEIKSYITIRVAPLLKCMMLADNEGWSLFDPETRAQQREDTLKAFREVEQLIS